MDYSADLRTRLTSAVDNGRSTTGASRWTASRSSRCTAPAPAPTGSRWDRDRPRRRQGQRRPLAVPGDAVGAGVVGLVLLLIALGTFLTRGLLRLGGAGAHAPARSSRPGVLALHAGIDWDWEFPALSSGCSARAAWRWRDRRRRGAPSFAPGPRAARAGRVPARDRPRCRLLAGAAASRRQRPSARATARGDRPAVAADLRFGVRPEPLEFLAWCDARAGGERSPAAADAAAARDPRTDSRLQRRDRLACTGPGPAAGGPGGARLNPLHPYAQPLVHDLVLPRTVASGGSSPWR